MAMAGQSTAVGRCTTPTAWASRRSAIGFRTMRATRRTIGSGRRRSFPGSPPRAKGSHPWPQPAKRRDRAARSFDFKARGKTMHEAVIVSTARTPIGKAGRGAFNMTHGATMGGHVIKHAVERAKLDPADVDDVIMGCAMPQGATGQNIARLSAIRAGLPVTVSGMTVNRFCSSGLQTIAMAAQRIMTGEAKTIVAGGLESCSLVGDQRSPVYEDWLKEHKPEMWMPMIETADIVAERYGVSRETQDAFALESQRRTAAAQQARRFDQEIVPLPSMKKNVNKDTKEESFEQVTLTKDEGNRPDTTPEGLAALKPVREGGYVTAANASQLSDGASACVVMEAK